MRKTLLFVLLGLMLPSSASADILPEGHHPIEASWEIANLADYPDHLFVAFPFAACRFDDPVYFELNPQNDKAERNYEVLRPGQRYEVQKFCFDMRIYAFEAKAFEARTEKLAEDMDWYRKAGHELTILKGFDELVTSKKLALVKDSDKVSRSDFVLPSALVIPDEFPVAGAHDVLRIDKLEGNVLTIVGDRVEFSMQNGAEAQRPYEGGARPEPPKQEPEQPADPEVDKPSQEPPPSVDAASGTLTAGAEPGVSGRYLAFGLAAAAFAGFAIVLVRRRS